MPAPASEAQTAAAAAASAGSAPVNPHSDVQAAKYLGEACHQLKHELAKVIVGQERVLDELLIAIFSRGMPSSGMTFCTLFRMA